MAFRTIRTMLSLAVVLALLAPPSFAQRGGGDRGGGRGGGGDRGGGFRGGGGGGPIGGGGGRSFGGGQPGGGGGFRSAPRGNLGSVPSFSRPSVRSVPNLSRSVPRSAPQMQPPRQTFGQSVRPDLARPNLPNLPQNVRPNLPDAARPNLPQTLPRDLTNRLPGTPAVPRDINRGNLPGNQNLLRPDRLPNQIGNRPQVGDPRNRVDDAINNLNRNLPGRTSVSRPDAFGNRIGDNRFDGRFDGGFDNDRFNRGPRHWNPYRYSGWNRGNWAVWGPNFAFGYGYGYPYYGYGYGPWWRYGWYNRPWGRWAALGLTSWALGGLYYNTGYGIYTNPYYVSGFDYGYNYGQPIAYVTTAEPQPPPDDAVAHFQAARDAFRNGDYQAALQHVDQAIAKNPNDPALHEFRSLVFFAMQRYTEASGAIYAVLSVGPGMNWSSLSALYASVDLYTPQLRALEGFVRQNPQDASGRFLLAYHYMVAGHTTEARTQFQKASTLAPNDAVSRQMVRLLTPPEPAEPGTENALPPAAAPTDTRSMTPVLTQPVGSYQAASGQNGTISLTLQNDGTFQWNVQQGDRPQQFTGKYTIEGDTLALEFQDGGGMVGRVQPKGNGFHFAIIDGPPNDPGLDFNRRN